MTPMQALQLLAQVAAQCALPKAGHIQVEQALAAKKWLLVKLIAATHALTLPTAVGFPGLVFILKNSGVGVITLNTTSAQTIDGNASGVLTLVAGQARTVRSNNANWILT